MINPFGSAFWRGFGAMTAYGAFHSILASPPAKKAARGVLGPRADSFYRLGYNAIALGSLAWLLISLLKKPGETVYEARGPGKYLMRIVGLAGLAYALWGGLAVGVGRLSGVGAALRGVAGVGESDPPEGQNPSFAHGAPRGGPFARHRHPLNFIVPIIFWCFSRGSQAFVGLNAAITAYCVIGSYLTDARMKARYGRAFEKYAARVPFLWPRLSKEK